MTFQRTAYDLEVENSVFTAKTKKWKTVRWTENVKLSLGRERNLRSFARWVLLCAERVFES